MATVRHSITDFCELINWTSVSLLNNECDLQYYNTSVADLRDVLMVYQGVRIRDIKYFFEQNTNYEINFERLKMPKGWPQFLLTLGPFLIFQLDSIKDEVFTSVIQLSEDTLKSTMVDSGDLQSLITGTPSSKEEAKAKPDTLVTIKSQTAYQLGYLDVAEGICQLDPRIPNQDLGVAAKKAREDALKAKNKAGGRSKVKLSFEEQVALSNANKSKFVTTTETTGPLPESQKESVLDDFFNSIEISDKPEEKKAPRDPFPANPFSGMG